MRALLSALVVALSTGCTTIAAGFRQTGPGAVLAHVMPSVVPGQAGGGGGGGSGVTSVTGTANQVIASGSTGAVTLSLPQSIGTGNAPTFAGANFNGTVELGSSSPIESFGSNPINITTAGSQPINFSTAGTLAMSIAADRGVTLGSPTGGDEGAGTINVTGGFYVNGALVTGGSPTWIASSAGGTATSTGASGAFAIGAGSNDQGGAYNTVVGPLAGSITAGTYTTILGANAQGGYESVAVGVNANAVAGYNVNVGGGATYGTSIAAIYAVNVGWEGVVASSGVNVGVSGSVASQGTAIGYHNTASANSFTGGYFATDGGTGGLMVIGSSSGPITQVWVGNGVAGSAPATYHMLADDYLETASSNAPTPTAGHDYLYGDSTAHTLMVSQNGGAYAAIGGISGVTGAPNPALTASSAATAGTVSLVAGNCTTAGNGGAVNITSGNGSGSGSHAGGNITLTTGNGVGSGGPGGTLTLTTGSGAFSGPLNIETGNGAAAGQVSISGGTGTGGTGTGGGVGIVGGNGGASGSGGYVYIDGGNGGTPGSVSISAGSPLNISNGSGAEVQIQGGAANGTGVSGAIDFQTSYPIASGTTAQTLGDRLYISGTVKSMSTTTGTATAFVALGLPTNNASGGAIVSYMIEASDGTHWDTATGSFSVSLVNAGGTVTGTSAAITNESSNCNSGTLTAGATSITISGTYALVNVAPAWTTIVPTTVRLSYTVTSFGNAMTVAPE